MQLLFIIQSSRGNVLQLVIEEELVVIPKKTVYLVVLTSVRSRCELGVG